MMSYLYMCLNVGKTFRGWNARQKTNTKIHEYTGLSKHKHRPKDTGK